MRPLISIKQDLKHLISKRLHKNRDKNKKIEEYNKENEMQYRVQSSWSIALRNSRRSISISIAIDSIHRKAYISFLCYQYRKQGFEGYEVIILNNDCTGCWRKILTLLPVGIVHGNK